MAKRHHRLLSALLAAMLLSSSMVTANAATVGADDSGAGALAKYYSTNATGVGKEATITIDGDASDWSEDMKIAQGAAWDVANHWKGGHENCVLDTYALYAAWDDSNLYIGWQMVNTTDTWAREGDGPLSDGGRVLDVPLIIALNTNSGKNPMTGRVTDGKGIWGVDIEFDTTVDTLLYMSGKPGLGTPGFFRAVDSSGVVDYLDTSSCQTFKDTGVEYKLAETNINSQIWGLNGSEDPMDVCDDSAEWVDYATTSHNTKYDSFYECKIPLSALGITKSDITSKGIGAMVVASRGESGLDCIPFDLTMLDNATADYSSDPSTSHEKDDKDTITASLASVGKGDIVPVPVISDTDKKTDTEKKDSDTASDTTTDTSVDPGDGQSTVSVGKVSKGDTVKLTLGVGDTKGLMGISNSLTVPNGLKFVGYKALVDGVVANAKDSSTVLWNANFADVDGGKTFTSAENLIEMTFTAESDIADASFVNIVRDCYDDSFKTLSFGCVEGKATVSSEPVSDTDKTTDVEIAEGTVKVDKAAEGDAIEVVFKTDVSKVEGVSAKFDYDESALKFMGYTKTLDSSTVQAKDTNGVVNWNCINTSKSGTEEVTLLFKALKPLSNSVIGTNQIKEMYDSNSKDVDAANLNVKAVVKSESTDTEEGTDTVTDFDEQAKNIPVSAKQGDIITVTFKAKGVKNAAGIQELVDFNTAALRYNNDAASPVGVIDADAANGRVAWNVMFDLGTDGKGADLSKETEVATMTFTALRDISDTENVLYYTVKDFYDIDEQVFEYSTAATAVAKLLPIGEGTVPVTAKQGNTVKVYCKGIDAARALGIVEELTYDSAALEYVGYGSEMGHFQVDASAKGKVRWSTMFDDAGTTLKVDNDIVVFTFKALRDITSTEDVLSYVVEEFYDYNLNDFDVMNNTMVRAVAIAPEKTVDSDPPTNTDSEYYPDVDTELTHDTDNTNPGDTDAAPVKDTDKETDGETDTDKKPVDTDKQSDIDTDNTSTDTDKGGNNDTDTSGKTDTDTSTDSKPADTDTKPNTDTDTSTDSKPADTDSASNTDTDKTTDTDSSKKNIVVIIFGDLDDDKSVTSGDAVTVLRSSSGMEELTPVQLVAADVNNDDSVASDDALSVLRFSANFQDANTRLTGQPVEVDISIKFK